jgi:YggT family protein
MRFMRRKDNIMETIIGSLLRAVASLIHIGLMIYLWCILIRAVLSWLSPDPYHPAIQFLYRITDPVYYRVRQLLPLDFGGIDFSPIIIVFIIYTVDELTYNILGGLASSLMGHQAFHGTHVFAYLLSAIAGIIHSILWIMIILFIGKTILSFFNPDPYNPIVRFIDRATEPLLNYFSSRLPLTYADFDLAPIVVLLFLYILDSFLLSTLRSASMSFMY